jgi:phosphomannomutase
MEALMIGVSGMRGTIGGTLTPPVVGRMAAAFAVFLKSQPRDPSRDASKPLKVVLGRDSRPSGAWVRDAAVSALVASGIEVIDLEIVTTPGVAMMVKHLGADAGVVVTASHNPIEWNGLKFLNAAAVAPPPADAARIRQIYDESRADYVRVQHLIQPAKDSQTHALHVKRVLDRVDNLGISTKRFKVVLDSVNGAGCIATATRWLFPPRPRAHRGKSHRAGKRSAPSTRGRRIRAGSGCGSVGDCGREWSLHRRGILAGALREMGAEQTTGDCRDQSLNQPNAR